MTTKSKRAKEHLQVLIVLAKMVGAWYNAPNEKVEESYLKKIGEVYERWCEYRHDYITSDPFEDGLQHFIDDLKKQSIKKAIGKKYAFMPSEIIILDIEEVVTK